uniref:DM5 domain-containing protein n=1 Tax=Gongylonema pulchrum TaxID=637853 RepID=A0A183E0Z3_9BILA
LFQPPAVENDKTTTSSTGLGFGNSIIPQGPQNGSPIRLYAHFDTKSNKFVIQEQLKFPIRGEGYAHRAAAAPIFSPLSQARSVGQKKTGSPVDGRAAVNMLTGMQKPATRLLTKPPFSTAVDCEVSDVILIFCVAKLSSW